MAAPGIVVGRVVSQKGSCEAGMTVGQEFAFGDITPAGICSFLYHAAFPFAVALQYGATFPWEEDPDTATVACPDAANPVVIELRRMRG